MTEIMTRERFIIWLEEVAHLSTGNQVLRVLEDSKDDELTICFKVKPRETYREMAFRKMIESFGVSLSHAEASMNPDCDLEYGAAIKGEDFDYLRTMINEVFEAGLKKGAEG
tara:strand:+ start:739 stop:1074 length:336 start_codon:yes stop_codon:yes gene_type:complete